MTARYHPNPPNGAIYDQDDLDRLRDFAVRAERERCAKIAENFDMEGSLGKLPRGWAGCRRMIAAAIRKQE